MTRESTGTSFVDGREHGPEQTTGYPDLDRATTDQILPDGVAFTNSHEREVAYGDLCHSRCGNG
jgi:hypothetical protein